MTIFLCLICFSIYDKLQGFTDESGLFISLFIFFFFFAFYAEIQEGRQKWRENNFFVESHQIESADTLWVKNFVEIALSHSVSEINAFLCLTQKLEIRRFFFFFSILFLLSSKPYTYQYKKVTNEHV